MVGISLCASYIPMLRLDRKIIADIWVRGSIGGERSVANNDEDSITLAVEASRNCLNTMDTEGIEGFFFATTTAPYQEKMNSALIAGAVDLKREITTLDFANSLRAGSRLAANSHRSAAARKSTPAARSAARTAAFAPAGTICEYAQWQNRIRFSVAIRS